METKYLHIAIDNEIQAAYDKGFQAGVDAVLNEPFPEHGDGGRVITKEELKFLDEDEDTEPQQDLEDPTEGLFSDDLIPKHTREHKSHKKGFKSEKHQWIDDHTDTLSSYVGFRFADVRQLFPQFTTSAVRNKLNKLGFRIKKGIIQPSQI